MITGTPYFPSEEAAIRYYRPYFDDDTVAEVARKLASGEIHIGRPPLKPGERCFLIDGYTRWAVKDGAL